MTNKAVAVVGIYHNIKDLARKTAAFGLYKAILGAMARIDALSALLKEDADFFAGKAVEIILLEFLTYFGGAGCSFLLFGMGKMSRH